MDLSASRMEKSAGVYEAEFNELELGEVWNSNRPVVVTSMTPSEKPFRSRTTVWVTSWVSCPNPFYYTFPKGEIEVNVMSRSRPRMARLEAFKGSWSSWKSDVIRFVLREGHLWGRREVAIPVSVVTSLQNGIHLNITKKQVQEMPSIKLSEPTP